MNFQIKHGKAGHLNSEMKQKLELDWRRNMVLELSSQGYTDREIASKLQISHITVHRDLVRLRKLAQDNLQKHIHETVPEEYQKCMVDTKSILKKTMQIAETVTDPRIKLQAHAVAEDCYKYILEMSTNAGIVSDALKYVTQQKEQLSSLQKLDDKIEEIEETTATNGVF